jgi:hypothetical protein
MAGVGDDSVLIGNGGVTDDEIQQLDPTPIDPPEPEGDDHDEGEGHEAEGEERQTTVDEELDAASNDAEREKIRARRRQERADKRQRAKDKSAAQERRISDLTAQNKGLEGRLLAIEKTQHSTTVAQLSVAEEQADTAIEQLMAAKVNATNAKDGPAMLEAERRIDAIKAHKKTLSDAKEKLERQVPQAPKQQPPASLVEQATKFRRENPWFVDTNQPNTNQDSRLVSAVDNQLLAEGWDPATPAYWEELRTRAGKYLPDRFKKGAQGGAQSAQGSDNPAMGSGSGAPTKRSPVAGGGGGGATGARTGVVQSKLSEARVQAIKDVGKWDDPVLRKKAIEAYQKYDRENARN